MFLSNTWCLFVDVEMSFKIWDTIYPLVNTCKQMNIQIFYVSSNNPGWVFFLVSFFVPFAVGRSWMPDKHGCDGLSDSYKVREVGWCQNIDFSDHCATNYLFFVVAISNILLTGLPHPQHPQPFGFLTPSVDLWTLTWWFVICAVVIYPSYFGIFICSPQVTFVANVNRIPQNLLLVVAINWFFFYIYLCWSVHTFIYVHVCVRALH